MQTTTPVPASKLKPGQKVRIIIEGTVQTPYEESNYIRVLDSDTDRVISLVIKDRTVLLLEES